VVERGTPGKDARHPRTPAAVTNRPTRRTARCTAKRATSRRITTALSGQRVRRPSHITIDLELTKE